MGIISYTLQNILLTFTALCTIHTVFGPERFQFGAVTGVTVLRAFAGSTAVAWFLALLAFAAGGVAAVAVSAVASSNCIITAVAGGVAAVARLFQLWLVGVDPDNLGVRWLFITQLIAQGFRGTFDFCARIVLSARSFDDACKYSHPTLLQGLKKAQF